MATYEQCFQWQCQYCTFINSKEVAMQTFQSRVICDICGKSTAWTDVMQKQQLTDKQKPVPKPRKLTRLKPSDHQNRSLEEADLDKSWNTRRAAADLTDEGSDGINWFSRYSRSRMSERSTLPSRREYLEHALSPSDEGATGYSESSSSGLELFKRSFKDKTFSAYQRSRAVHNSSLRTSGERKNVQSPAKVVVGECPVCTEDKLLLEVPFCRCAVCSDCLCQQIEVRLNNSSSVSGLTCPVCDKLDNEALTDTSCEYFAQLQSLLIGKLKPGVMAKLDERLRDWRLKLTDNFCWCSGCSNGFEVSEHHDRQVRCPQCRKETCRKCGKAWHEQHRGVSCQQFAEWRERTDAGERGLAEFLQSRGSSCPMCGLKFEVSRGGCLHITCTRCKAEFCSDCGSPFVREECCGGTKGLHCHHDKECVETFRDWPIEKVRQAALEKGVQLDRFSGSSGSQCRVKEQKDTAGGRLVDEECGKPAIEYGKCEKHLKEALVIGMCSRKAKALVDTSLTYSCNEIDELPQISQMMACLPSPIMDRQQKQSNQNVSVPNPCRLASTFIPISIFANADCSNSGGEESWSPVHEFAGASDDGDDDDDDDREYMENAWYRDEYEKERLEKERQEKERQEKERQEKERQEKERLEEERLEKERLEKERQEKARLERELQERRMEEERVHYQILEEERQMREQQERLNMERKQELEDLMRYITQELLK